jgi:hypothetical protein
MATPARALAARATFALAAGAILALAAPAHASEPL